MPFEHICLVAHKVWVLVSSNSSAAFSRPLLMSPTASAVAATTAAACATAVCCMWIFHLDSGLFVVLLPLQLLPICPLTLTLLFYPNHANCEP